MKIRQNIIKYTDIGGSCTNYVSQSIGNKEGGGIEFDDIGQCPYNKHGEMFKI
ncbi:amidase domain-containing protein [Clostridium sp.]|uniref:amidase domain-containing protein n=1 Tax=Clostridium sp. TaxID=1506 RepID=UPI003FD73C0C